MPSKIGDKRSYMGIEFVATETLKTFDGRDRGVRWEAGHIAASIDEHTLTSHGHPFKAGTIHCRSFENAARRAIVGAYREYERAKKIVAKYESVPELIRSAAKGIVEERA